MRFIITFAVKIAFEKYWSNIFAARIFKKKKKLLEGKLYKYYRLKQMLQCSRGIEAIVVDYVRPSIFGKVIPKLAVGAVYALSFFTLGGLCYFIYTDVGIINAVKLLWKL